MLVADLVEVLQQLPATAPVFVRVSGHYDAVTIDAAEYSGGRVRILLDGDELVNGLGPVDGDDDE